MKPLDQLSDHEINAMLAVFCGWKSKPEPFRGSCITRWIDPDGEIHLSPLDALHDHNAIAKVEARLRELDIEHSVQWIAGQYLAVAKPCFRWHKDRLRAQCLAVCAMIQSQKEEA